MDLKNITRNRTFTPSAESSKQNLSGKPKKQNIIEGKDEPKPTILMCSPIREEPPSIDPSSNVNYSESNSLLLNKSHENFLFSNTLINSNIKKSRRKRKDRINSRDPSNVDITITESQLSELGKEDKEERYKGTDRNYLDDTFEGQTHLETIEESKTNKSQIELPPAIQTVAGLERFLKQYEIFNSISARKDRLAIEVNINNFAMESELSTKPNMDSQELNSQLYSESTNSRSFNNLLEQEKNKIIQEIKKIECESKTRNLKVHNTNELNFDFGTSYRNKEIQNEIQNHNLSIESGFQFNIELQNKPDFNKSTSTDKLLAFTNLDSIHKNLEYEALDDIKLSLKTDIESIHILNKPLENELKKVISENTYSVLDYEDISGLNLILKSETKSLGIQKINIPNNDIETFDIFNLILESPEQPILPPQPIKKKNNEIEELETLYFNLEIEMRSKGNQILIKENAIENLLGIDLDLANSTYKAKGCQASLPIQTDYHHKNIFDGCNFQTLEEISLNYSNTLEIDNIVPYGYVLRSKNLTTSLIYELQLQLDNVSKLNDCHAQTENVITRDCGNFDEDQTSKAQNNSYMSNAKVLNSHTQTSQKKFLDFAHFIYSKEKNGKLEFVNFNQLNISPIKRKEKSVGISNFYEDKHMHTSRINQDIQTEPILVENENSCSKNLSFSQTKTFTLEFQNHDEKKEILTKDMNTLTDREDYHSNSKIMSLESIKPISFHSKSIKAIKTKDEITNTPIQRTEPKECQSEQIYKKSKSIQKNTICNDVSVNTLFNSEIYDEFICSIFKNEGIRNETREEIHSLFPKKGEKAKLSVECFDVSIQYEPLVMSFCESSFIESSSSHLESNEDSNSELNRSLSSHKESSNEESISEKNKNIPNEFSPKSIPRDSLLCCDFGEEKSAKKKNTIHHNINFQKIKNEDTSSFAKPFLLEDEAEKPIKMEKQHSNPLLKSVEKEKNEIINNKIEESFNTFVVNNENEEIDILQRLNEDVNRNEENKFNGSGIKPFEEERTKFRLNLSSGNDNPNFQRSFENIIIETLNNSEPNPFIQKSNHLKNQDLAKKKVCSKSTLTDFSFKNDTASKYDEINPICNKDTPNVNKFIYNNSMELKEFQLTDSNENLKMQMKPKINSESITFSPMRESKAIVYIQRWWRDKSNSTSRMHQISNQTRNAPIKDFHNDLTKLIPGLPSNNSLLDYSLLMNCMDDETFKKMQLMVLSMYFCFKTLEGNK